MSRYPPRPTVYSEWGVDFQRVWVLFGRVDGSRHALNGISDHLAKMSAWEATWNYMTANVMWDSDGFNSSFKRFCYHSYQAGYRSYDNVEDIGNVRPGIRMHQKARLLQPVWDDLWTMEPRELDEWWL